MKELSPEEWEAWRDNPVTQLIRDSLARMLDRKRQWALDQYWRGSPVSEASRLALVGLGEWHEDFFTLTYDEMKAAIEDER